MKKYFLNKNVNIQNKILKKKKKKKRKKKKEKKYIENLQLVKHGQHFWKNKLHALYYQLVLKGEKKKQ